MFQEHCVDDKELWQIKSATPHRALHKIDVTSFTDEEIGTKGFADVSKIVAYARARIRTQASVSPLLQRRHVRSPNSPRSMELRSAEWEKRHVASVM